MSGTYGRFLRMLESRLSDVEGEEEEEDDDDNNDDDNDDAVEDGEEDGEEDGKIYYTHMCMCVTS